MMMRRRRPLLRGAMVAGGAYAVGKNSANKAAANAQQDARISQLEAEQQSQMAPPPQAYAAPPPAAAPAPAPAADDTMDKLEKLATMHGSGALTDEEFAAAKAKLLGI